MSDQELDALLSDVPTDHSYGVFLHQEITRAKHTPGQPGALDGDMTIEAVPSWYSGIVFRSKLEADWAATLDEWRIPWQYEPETIILPSGATYIPDFWLPDHGIWLEVKGTGVPRIEKAIDLGKARACHCDGDCTCRWSGGEFVLIGHPPVQYNPWADYDPEADHRPWWAIQRAAWRHHGHINWSNTNGRTTWLVTCPDCERGGWAGGGTHVRCRACGSRMAGSPAFNPGDPELLFVDSSCRVAPARPTEEAS
jgi:hypothetical protein